jgi:hypothetical protein
LKKIYTTDYLKKNKKFNGGEVPQYYIENAHEPIISPAVFEMVQHEMQKRQSGETRHSGVGMFSSKIKCGECGSWYGSKVWHSTSKYRRTIYQCNGKFKNAKKCGTPHLDEEAIKRLYVSAANKLLSDKKEIIDDIELIKQAIFNTDALEAERTELQNELAVVVGLMQKCVDENARVALNQAEYQQRYNSLAERYEEVKSRLETVTDDISSKKSRRGLLNAFVAEVTKQGSTITEFDEQMWHSLLDYATVYNEKDVRFTFKNGMEIQA